MLARHSPRPVINPPLTRFLAARGVSILGDSMAALVIPLLVLQRTGSPLDAGLAGAAQRLPVTFFALWAGSVTDRAGPRAIMIAADLAGAAVYFGLAALIVWGHLSLGALLLGVFLAGSAEVWFVVAAGAFMPWLVQREKLPAANGYLEAVDSTTIVVGPALGGLVLQSFGAASAIIANAASFVLSAAFLSSVRPMNRAAIATDRAPRGSLLAGFTELRRHVPQRLLQTILGGLNLYTAVILLLIVALGRDVLHLSGFRIGVILSGAGIGGFLSTLVLAPRLPLHRWRSLLAILLFVMAGGLGLLSVARGIGMAFVANLLVDGAACLAFALAASVRQIVTPPELLGRMVAASHLLNSAVRVIGVAGAGWLIVQVGHRQTIGMLALLLALLGSGVAFAPISRDHLETTVSSR